MEEPNIFKEPQQEQKKGLFAKKPEPTQAIDLSGELASLTTRLRIAEERYTNLRRKLQFIEQNMLDSNKKTKTDIKTIELDIKEIRKEIAESKDALRHLIDELNKFAKLEDIKVLQKYIEMWEPVKFVTQGEVQKIINETLQKQKPRKL